MTTTKNTDYIIDLLMENGFNEMEAIEFFGRAYLEFKKLEDELDNECLS